MILIRNRLSAGFFSNLNAVISWYWYSMRTEIPIYIYWDGIHNKNIFDIFFHQKYKHGCYNYENNTFIQHSPLFTDQIKEAFKEDIGKELYEKYESGWYLCKGMIYSDDKFYKLRELHNYIYNENLILNSNLISPINIPRKTLGINYRFIDMYFTDDGKRTPFKSIMSLEEYNNKYLQQMESTFESGKFDKIYLASSQQCFFDICLEKFKDKLLYLPMKRLDEGLWQQYRKVPLEKEFSDVLTDVINLSRCEELLISPSNIAFGLLFMNLKIKYTVFDFLKQTHTD